MVEHDFDNTISALAAHKLLAKKYVKTESDGLAGRVFIMNKLILVAILICLSQGCQHKEVTPASALTACGVNDPATQLDWLKSIITKAELDRTARTYSGNYVGEIYLEKFNDRDVFYTTMALGSGGLAFRLFSCDGQPVSFSSNEQLLTFTQSAQKSKLIYTNIP